MYGEIAIYYEIAVHFYNFNIPARGRGKPLPYDSEGLFHSPVFYVKSSVLIGMA